MGIISEIFKTRKEKIVNNISSMIIDYSASTIESIENERVGRPPIGGEKVIQLMKEAVGLSDDEIGTVDFFEIKTDLIWECTSFFTYIVEYHLVKSESEEKSRNVIGEIQQSVLHSFVSTFYPDLSNERKEEHMGLLLDQHIENTKEYRKYDKMFHGKGEDLKDVLAGQLPMKILRMMKSADSGIWSNVMYFINDFLDKLPSMKLKRLR